ncbi:hypothetical protein D3C76_1319200 [compost metagenome]
MLGAAVVQERLAFQLCFLAFTNEGETEEFQGFTVDVQARARSAQRQGDAHAVLADGEHFDFFLGLGGFALAAARVADGLVGLVQHLQGQAVDDFLERRVVLEAGQDAADREFAAQVFEGGDVGGLGVLELLELAHQFVGFVIVEAVVGLTDRGTQFADLVAFAGGLESVQHHLADGFCLGHVL